MRSILSFIQWDVRVAQLAAFAKLIDPCFLGGALKDSEPCFEDIGLTVAFWVSARLRGRGGGGGDRLAVRAAALGPTAPLLLQLRLREKDESHRGRGHG